MQALVAAFGHKFGALESTKDELREAIDGVKSVDALVCVECLLSHHVQSSMALVNWNKLDLFSQYGVLELLPPKLASFLLRLPFKRLAIMHTAGKHLSGVAERIVGDKTDTLMKGLDGGKDLMSILMRANANEKESAKLSENEVISEIACAFRFVHEINMSND
jgi:hypothetical protein